MVAVTVFSRLVSEGAKGGRFKKKIFYCVIATLTGILAVMINNQRQRCLRGPKERSQRGLHVDLQPNMTTSNVKTPNLKTVPFSLPKEKVLAVLVKARLGNNMYQFASGLGIAKRTGLQPVFVMLEEYMELFQTFDIPYMCISVEQFMKHDPFVYSQLGVTSIYHNSTEKLGSLAKNIKRDVLLDGYWQSYQYFANLEDKGMNIFKFKPAVLEKAKSYLDEAMPQSEENVVYIGVHLRLQDRVHNWGINEGDSKKDYLVRAVTYFKEKYDHVQFVVCTDDIEGAREVFPSGQPAVYSLNDMGVDMAILTLCNHTLTTAGTFSWWAGYLAGGDVVYYKNNEEFEWYSLDHIHNHIYPKNWIPL